MKNLVLPILVFIAFSCSPKEDWNPVLLDKEAGSLRIAFGSCAHSYDTLKIFNSINNRQPELWIWLGDIVYGDTHDMAVLKAKYDKQKAKPEYQELLQNTKVIGIWDDHDYGINDGGKYYSKKDESKELLLSFLDVHPDDPVRQHKGAYSAYSVRTGDKVVRVILPDTRYFRDTLATDTVSLARYLPNEQGDILGEEQWQWLADELSAENVDLFLVGMSIQLIAEEQGFEKWANFPAARNRFFELLKNTGSTPVFIMSGDRHIAELSKIDLENLNYPLYDLTASGLTHTWGMAHGEPNKYRVDSLIISKNYGLLDIEFIDDRPVIDLKVLDEADKILLSKQIQY